VLSLPEVTVGHLPFISLYLEHRMTALEKAALGLMNSLYWGLKVFNIVSKYM
jgi:hypothetical protein